MNFSKEFLEEDIEGEEYHGCSSYETLNNTIFHLLFQQEDDKKCMGYACIIGTLAGDTWPITVERCLVDWQRNLIMFLRMDVRSIVLKIAREEVLKNSSYREKL